jgi:RND superfamily putative drug exporter
MATYLYRLAKFSFRRRWLVLFVWLLVLVGVGAGAATLSRPSSDRFTIPGIESQQAIDILAQKFPSAAADGATARIVFVSTDGSPITGTVGTTAVDDFIAAVKDGSKVSSVSEPLTQGIVSQDGSTTYVTVTFSVQSSELKPADRDAVISAADAQRSDAIRVEAGGDALKAQVPTSATEIIGVVIGAIVLAITFGSLVAAGLPLLTALIGVAVGLSGVMTVGHWVDLSSTAPVLALMLGLAVGIDYALFIVSRYRHELLSGVEEQEAIGRAAGTAGSAVVFAGLTVLIALSGLAVVGIPFLTTMGLAAAATVGIAVLIALTLLPALLGFAGGKIVAAKVPFVRRGPDFDNDAPDAPTSFGERWSRWVIKHKAPVLGVAITILGVIAIPFFSLATTLPDDGTADPGSSARITYDLLGEKFGPGFNGPLIVALTNDGTADLAASATAVKAELEGIADVATVSPASLNKAGDTALLQVIPASSPSSGQTQDLVRAIRALESTTTADQGVRLYVTGATALTIDVTDKLNAALPIYLIVVVGLALILLLLVFRSVIVPIKAAVGFLLTIGATFGALVAIFQWGWLASLLGVNQAAPIIAFLPIILIAILFGLAMDYEVFLVSRMREDFVHGQSATEAVVGGFRHGARVVTAAAIIMISVFAGFMLGHDPIIKSIGFALSFGVFVDAFIVRMTIVPAVMAIVGKSAWWIPRWLDAVLPNVDVEGEKLLKRLQTSPADQELEPAH